MAGVSIENHCDNEALLTENDTELLFLIGDDNCSYMDVIQCVELHKSTKISVKMIEIAIELEISGNTIEKWNRQIAQGTYNITLIFMEILQEFRSKYASGATLQKLMHVLIRQDLYQEAVRLGAKFGINVEGNKQFQDLRARSNILATLSCVTVILIVLAVIGATCLITFLAKEDEVNGCPLKSMNTNDINDLVFDWAKSLENGNFSEIQDVLTKCLFSNDTNLVLTESIKVAYNGSLNHFPAVMMFVHGIKFPWYQYNGYFALRSAMNVSGHDHTKEMIKLAYFIKTTMTNDSIGSELSKAYTDLAASVPENIRLIVFKQCVSVRSVYYNEYMYLSTLTAKSQKLVMTWRGTVEPLWKFQQSFWYFEVGYENDEIFFRLRNHNFGDNSAMCPSSEYFNMQRRETVGCPGDDKVDLRWTVTPVDDNMYFTIKSWDGYYLYSPNNKNVYKWIFPMRYTFTWTGASEDILRNRKAYWDILRCPP